MAHVLEGSTPSGHSNFMKQSKISGTTLAHWVDPYSRDSTRGTNETTFKSMHSSELRQQMVPVSCEVCGMTFGLVEGTDSKVKTGYCGDHAWVGELEAKGIRVLEIKKPKKVCKV